MVEQKNTNANPNQKFGDLIYQSGFYNEHSTEVLVGALPEGGFSPQKLAYGLYAEKFSVTSFTAPRDRNFRNWFYRIKPSVVKGDFYPIDKKHVRSAPISDAEITPNPIRWDPLPIPNQPIDFVDGMHTMAANGRVGVEGFAVHLYTANKSMQHRFYACNDGELLILPQLGGLLAHTECGVIDISPGEVCVIPRGMKFRIVLQDDHSRGYICENYGAKFRLPERGPVGSDGFANDRDFLSPVASYEDREGDFELVNKFMGNLFACDIHHSPLDVVAWIGTAFPYKYDLSRFNTMNTVSYDHPDPSIFTVLTSDSDTIGVANIDFVIFPPRWMVAENTFRPPWYHRNVMSEFMGLIYGKYDAKVEGFIPGGASLHNCMAAHGPDAEAFSNGSTSELHPVRYTDTMAFMFESRYVIQPTKFAMEISQRQGGYTQCWQDLKKNFDPKKKY